ncbi:MAG: hypothetical protein WBZ23_12255, partial [Pseudolabrys sp.]
QRTQQVDGFHLNFRQYLGLASSIGGLSAPISSKNDNFEPVLVSNRGTFSSGPACTVGVASQGATNCGQQLPEAS